MKSLNGIHCISKFNVKDFINEKQIGNIDILFTFTSNETSNLNILLAINNGTTIQNLCLMSLETLILNHSKTEIIVISISKKKKIYLKDYGLYNELHFRIIEFPEKHDKLNFQSDQRTFEIFWLKIVHFRRFIKS